MNLPPLGEQITAIKGGTAILTDRELPNALLLIEGERLAYLAANEEGRIPERARRVDAAGLYVLPGLIDTHVHGSHGDDVMLHGEEGLRRISRRFPHYGTTAWLPSTI